MAGQIGPYRLDEELGRGSMGIVYRGFEPAIGRQVAVKIVRSQQFSTSDEDAQMKVRFAREAAAAGTLSHDNIVVIYRLEEENGVQYIGMEFVAGVSLEKMLAPGAPMETQMALSILSQIAGALDYAHAKGVIHRDIKPANILVRPDGRIKITDFGIARIASQTITETGMTMGTPAYMAPEQIRGSKVDGKADQFSLAVMAYQMLSGRRPFDAEGHALMYQIVNGEPPALNCVNTFLPPACTSAVNRGLAKEPERRYPTCSAFVQALRESFVWRERPEPTTRKSDPAEMPGQLRRRLPASSWRAILIVAGAVACVALAGFGYSVYFSKARNDAAKVAPPERRAITPPNRETTSPKSFVADPVAPQRAAGPPAKETAPPLESRAATTPRNAAITREIRPATATKNHAADPPTNRAPTPVTETDKPPASLAPTHRAGELKLNPKDGLKYAWIPSGTFQMGCSPGDSECFDDEKPAHEVTIGKSFWLGQTAVTQVAYQRVTGKDPSHFKGANLPVETVNWEEARGYCAATGGRLPTEAEWEYAARAGSPAALYGPLDAIAWYDANSGGKTHEVGQKQKNAWGLHDMLGNVWQWTADWYDAGQQSKVLRGGSWLINPRDLRVSYRYRNLPENRYSFIGFRCAGE
jgi:formylglycine-generating enzyme required for sulfatase activity/tRNA A-37 threonylcarbamoyl transferase component Bud32